MRVDVILLIGLHFPLTNCLKLWISKTCPYAARAWVCSIEKDVGVQLEFVDLKNKPPEFNELYKSITADHTASAKVPVLEDGDFKLIESAIIVQYLEDQYPQNGSRLSPNTPKDKAVMRLFVDTYEKSLAPMMIKVISSMDDPVAFEKTKEDLIRNMLIVNRFLEKYALADGPFLFGEKFSIAEIQTGPFIQRLVQVVKSMCELDLLEVCEAEGFLNLKQWMIGVLERPSLKLAMVPDDELVKSYQALKDRLTQQQHNK